MAANLTTTYASQILDLLRLSKFKGGQCPPCPPDKNIPAISGFALVSPARDQRPGLCEIETHASVRCFGSGGRVQRPPGPSNPIRETAVPVIRTPEAPCASV